MRKFNFVLSAAAVLLPQVAQAQAIFESHGLHAATAGAGSGLAASAGALGGAINHSVGVNTADINKALAAWQANAAANLKAKHYAQAQQSYKTALSLVARRDGPGSQASIPILKNLVCVSDAMGKLEDSIAYRKSLFAVTGDKMSESDRLATTMKLSDLYLKKSDYTSAEPWLKQSYQAVSTNSAACPSEKRAVLLDQYSNVLRVLHRDTEAAKIEKESDQLRNSQVAAPQAQ